MVNYYLSYAYLKMNDPEKSIYFLNQTLINDQDYKAVVGDTAMANFLAGNSESVTDLYFVLAGRELEKIVADNPHTETADRILHHLAYYFLSKKEFAKAIDQFRRVYATAPDDTEYDRNALLMIFKILSLEMNKEEESREFSDLLLKKYPGTDEAAEVLFNMAQRDENQMRILSKRYSSLNRFAERWAGDSSLGTQAITASQQAKTDREASEKYRSLALKKYQRLIADYKNSRFASPAQLKLSQL